MARLAGLEPATPSLEGWCSIRLSYKRKWSGWRDSNPRHPAPKAGALPNCATSRQTLCKWLKYKITFEELAIIAT